MVFHKSASTFRQGSMTMPAEYYTSPAIFAEETKRIGARLWHCVGRSASIGRPGDYFLAAVADTSLIIVRDGGGSARAHVNVCRHRGTRICEQTPGSFSETIQCPYHAWTYSIDGRLIGAPHMQEVEGFVKAEYGLHQARIVEWQGFLFVNLDRSSVDFAQWIAPMESRLSRFGLSSLVSGRRVTYQVETNWKLIFQNYSECLHCPMIHPELNCKVPYTSGANDLIEGPFLGGHMEITEGNASVTMSGERIGPLVAALPVEDQRRGYYYSLMPNLLLSLFPDYVVSYLVKPVSAERTIVESEWLFHPDAVTKPGFDPSDAVEIWDRTNRQDWRICELSLSGIKSSFYQPGPYSPRESLPAAWDRAYLETMGR